MLLFAILTFIGSNKQKIQKEKLINNINYIDEPSPTPSPTPEAIPLSIGLGQMTKTNDILCSDNSCPSGDNLPTGSYDINSPTFYQCGTICNTSSGTFEYNFKGVKFGIIGTKTPDHHSFKVDIDGTITEISTYKDTREEYSTLYVSEDLEYKDHNIKIIGNNELYELYKLVYWPHLYARRLNATDFAEQTGTWNTQSDLVGGLRHYAFEDGTTDSIKSRIWTSHVWFYGSKCGWCEHFDMSIGDDIKEKLELKEGSSSERFDTILIYESNELGLNYYDVKLESPGDATLNCIFYIDEPGLPPSPTPEAIPLSIGLGQMTKTNDILCSDNSCPSGDNLPTGSYDINSPTFYQCGMICNTSSGTFEYNFKGVKFGIIGTKTPDHHSFKVDIDGTITEISTYKDTREEYSTLYVSEDLEYKDHNIKIIGNNELIELYKLVYWPHLYAKRLNATDFAEQTGTWKTQSDLVGGLRHYATQDSTIDSIKSVIPFSKVWIYGSKCSWCNHFNMTLGDINQKLELNSPGRTDTILLYESDEFISEEYKIEFSSPGDATLNCIFYIDEPSPPPSPTPKSIPLSIGLGQMTKTNDILCSDNSCPSGDNLPTGSYDINSPTFYQCGTICNTSSGTFEYNFKGVKFGIIGTASPKSYSFTVEIDGQDTKVNTHKATANEYFTLYVSEDLEYKDHNIKIKGNNELIELYKLVYWPHLYARRLNATDFAEQTGTWNTQSDLVGGLRHYAFEDGTTDSIKSRIWTSHVWFYGSKCGWCEHFDMSIGDDIKEKLELKEGSSSERFDTILIYESNELGLNYYDVKLESPGDATLNCIFYIDEPGLPPSPTPEAIPLSIGLGQMTKTNDILCSDNSCPSGDNLPTGSYDINSPTFYQCGMICNTSSGTFEYNFKGVKFGIIGTKTPDHHSFKVDIDGTITEISTYKDTREEYSTLYVSEDLEYKDHNIKIIGNNELIELYKLVYWPHLYAKRLNATDFAEQTGTWKTQSDLVGGLRHYATQDSTIDSIKSVIPFSKVWIYGSKCSWCNHFNMTLGDINQKLELNSPGRTDTILLYESDEFISEEYKIEFSSPGDATLNCIFYIDEPSPPPSPTPKSIPLSIGLGQMTKTNDILCSDNSCPSGDNLPTGSYDINSPTFYQCGTICNTSSGTFEYNFKGVKFGIIGTASPKSYSFTVEIDGQDTKVNTHKATANEYSTLYVSEDLEYKDHNIKIKGNNELYELYKLVYWPHLYARRLNATDFAEQTGTWNTQSDLVGGLRHYAFEDGTTDSIKSRIWTSHVWFYGSKCGWCEHFDMSIGDDIKEKLELKEGSSSERFDTILIYESNELGLNYYDVKLESPGDATLNCIFYIDEPGPPPSPTPEAIPLSIGLGQMTKTNDILCSDNSCPSGDNLPTGSYDINSPTFYQCGTICNTSSGTFEYNFKGVKFGIIGTKTPDHHSFKVDIDGTITEISTYKDTREEYSTLYVSEDLEYKDHNIKIIGNNELIELYKLVYWPHLYAKRLNATDFAEQTGTWKTQSDLVGGLRHYATNDESPGDSIKSRISTSYIWIYGTKCSWCHSFDLTIGDDIKENLNLNQGPQGQRYDTLLIYETKELEPKYYDVKLVSSGDATLNCIYYIEFKSEEITKNDCGDNKRCEYEETENKPVNVYINATIFNNMKEDVDGSAIHIINAGLRCNKSSFTDCGTGNKVGGAIYLKNDLDFELNVVILEHITFNNCQAKYGGAVYIYSKSELSPIIVFDCKFIGNRATGSTSDDAYGGSAIYLAVSNSDLTSNLFQGNKGKGGAIKIVDLFGSNNKAMLMNKKEASLIISKCSFDINSESDCSLFYISGKYGSLVELKDSVFTGKLSSKSHYIKGLMADKEAPKLLVNNCKFADNPKKSFSNLDLLSIDLKNQIFEENIDDVLNKNKNKKTKLMSNELMLAASVFISALALVVLVLAMIIKKKSQNDLDEMDTQAINIDSFIDSSL